MPATLDENVTQVDANITSAAPEQVAPDSPASFLDIASKVLAENPPEQIDSSVEPANQTTEQVAQPVTQSPAIQGLSQDFVQQLTTQWGLSPQQVQQWQSPEQVAQAAFQALGNVQYQANQQIERLQQEIAYYRQNAQQAPAVQQPVVTQVAQEQLKPPAFDKSLFQYLKRDPETGRFVAKNPGAINPSVVDAANDYESRRQKWAENFADDPDTYIQKAVEARLKETEERAAQRAIEWQQQQQQVEQARQTSRSILASNATWMCQRDANGNVQMDASGRVPVLTAQGHEYVEILKQIEADPEYSRLSTQRQDQLAKRFMTQPAAVAPTQQAASRAQAYTNGNGSAAAMHTPSKNGTDIPSMPGGSRPNPSNSFMAIASQNLEKDGFAPLYDTTRVL